MGGRRQEQLAAASAMARVFSRVTGILVERWKDSLDVI